MIFPTASYGTTPQKCFKMYSIVSWEIIEPKHVPIRIHIYFLFSCGKTIGSHVLKRTTLCSFIKVDKFIFKIVIAYNKNSGGHPQSVNNVWNRCREGEWFWGFWRLHSSNYPLFFFFLFKSNLFTGYPQTLDIVCSFSIFLFWHVCAVSGCVAPFLAGPYPDIFLSGRWSCWNDQIK